MPLDKYCDGIDHCGDLSDEPKFCTGMSSHIFLHRSQHDSSGAVLWTSEQKESFEHEINFCIFSSTHT